MFFVFLFLQKQCKIDLNLILTQQIKKKGDVIVLLLILWKMMFLMWKLW